LEKPTESSSMIPAAGYVSRAALKLIAGLDAGAISIEGKICLDVGSSTGALRKCCLSAARQKFSPSMLGATSSTRESGTTPKSLCWNRKTRAI